MNKWHGGASNSGGAAKTLFPVIFDGEGNRVCNVDSWPEGNAEGNYEHILLCVNAHDEDCKLIAAASALRAKHERIGRLVCGSKEALQEIAQAYYDGDEPNLMHWGQLEAILKEVDE